MNIFNLRILLILSLGHFVTDIYQGALPTILPFLKERLALSYTMTGVILMVANFTSSIIQPLLGYFSDRQEKPLLLPIGCLCAGIGFCCLSLTASYPTVLLLVVLSGLGIASYHPEGYKTAHFFTGKKAVAGMAIFSVGGNLGFALGPILSIYLIRDFGFASLPVMAIPVLVFLVIIAIAWKRIKIPDGEKTKTGPRAATGKPFTWISLPLLTIIAFVLVRSWMQMGLMSYIPFYYINHLHMDPLYAGQLVFTLLVGSVFGTLGLAPLADRWGHKRYLVITMLLAVIVAPILPFCNGWPLFIVLGILGMLIGSTFSVTIVMAQHLMPNNLGIASGLMVGFAIGAGGICVTLLGVVADNFGVSFAFKSIMALPLLGLVLTMTLRYPEKDL